MRKRSTFFDSEYKIGELNPGNIFGEIGIIKNESRNATIFCKTNVTCAVLNKHFFKKYLLKIGNKLLCSNVAFLNNYKLLCARTFNRICNIMEYFIK